MTKLILCKHEWLEGYIHNKTSSYVPGQQIIQPDRQAIPDPDKHIHHGIIISVDNDSQKSYVLWQTVPEFISIWTSVIVTRFDVTPTSRKLRATWTTKI